MTRVRGCNVGFATERVVIGSDVSWRPIVSDCGVDELPLAIIILNITLRCADITEYHHQQLLSPPIPLSHSHSHSAR